MEDDYRIEYLRQHIIEMKKAILEDGVDIRYIQSLLGHRSPKSTEIYLHISNKTLIGIHSPFDKKGGDKNG